MKPAIKRFFSDKNGRMVIGQRPNALIIAWALLLVVGKLLPDGPIRQIVGWLSTVALVIWAILEIGWGDSYFRRVLGALVLAVTIISRLG